MRDDDAVLDRIIFKRFLYPFFTVDFFILSGFLQVFKIFIDTVICIVIFIDKMIEFRIFQKYFVRLIVRILFVFFTIVYLKLFNKIAIKYNRSDLTILLLRNIKIFNRAEKPLLLLLFHEKYNKKK